MWFFCFNSNIRCIFDALAFVVAMHFIALHTLGWITRQPKAIDFKHESKIQQGRGRGRESESERKQLLSTIFTIIIFYFQLVCFLCTFWTLHSCSRCKIIVHTWSDEIYRNFYHSLFSLPFFRVACGFFPLISHLKAFQLEFGEQRPYVTNARRNFFCFFSV